MNSTELIEFSRTNIHAGRFVIAATDDYAACRCCLLNGLFAGLRLGAEAVEKYLKAFVLYADPLHNVKQYIHKIKDVATVASDLEPTFNTVQFSHVIERLERHYRQRYPDVRDFDRNASTAELVGIDELVLHICDSFPIPMCPSFAITDIFLLSVVRGFQEIHIKNGWSETISHYSAFGVLCYNATRLWKENSVTMKPVKRSSRVTLCLAKMPL
jgi:hypothetical protein